MSLARTPGWAKQASSLRPNRVGNDVGSSIEIAAEEMVEGEDVEEAGSRKTLRIQDPHEPDDETREEHQRTHLPYRNWCRHCVMGRGKEMAHKQQAELPKYMELHLDFRSQGDEDGSKVLTILVARERLTKMTMASMASSTVS